MVLTLVCLFSIFNPFLLLSPENLPVGASSPLSATVLLNYISHPLEKTFSKPVTVVSSSDTGRNTNRSAGKLAFLLVRWGRRSNRVPVSWSAANATGCTSTPLVTGRGETAVVLVVAVLVALVGVST